MIDKLAEMTGSERTAAVAGNCALIVTISHLEAIVSGRHLSSW